MNIQYNQLKKIDTFLSYFFPQLNFGLRELDRPNSERLIGYLTIIIDTLIKGENLYKKRNFILPEGKSLFSADIIDLMQNISLYLYKFDTTIFAFTRTERQTFIFIIENIIDYFKRGRFFADKKEQKNLFIDYRFWVENFFKMFNQKITGSLYSSKKLNLKNFFYSNDNLNNELIYSNTSISFSISPFIISRENKNYYLSHVIDGELFYKDITSDDQKDLVIKNSKYDLKVYELLFANFEFTTAKLFIEKLAKERHVLLDKAQEIENSYNYHKEKLFTESYELIKDITLESVDLPLVYLLQIKNLININRFFEVKKLLQKFVTLYPYYADGYELMGDVYLKEEDFEMSLNYFEKALKITQNKRIAEKLKKIRDSIEKHREKSSKQKSDNFYDISESVFHNEEKILKREKELRQMGEILLSGSRRNVMLVGDSGVGKTTLIKRLALDIINGDVPEQLKNIRLKEINFVSLLTGSKYRGQFEEKVLKLFNDFKTQPAILVLEDIHMMITSGAPRGTSLDLVNILKQFLREKSIQVIATTNYEEFKNTIEKDMALMGFFQKVTVNEMNDSDIRKVLKNLAEDIFSREKVIVSEEIIDQIIESARRDVRDKKCPDSAIMIFERAVAKVKLKSFTDDVNKCKVEPSDVAEVLSDILNLPESNLPLSLKERLLNLDGNLLTQVVGQDKSIERMSAAIITAKMEFDTKRNRPDGVFLFIGPTGVGKTHLAKILARYLFDSEDALVRIDMSEYMEKFAVSRLVGAPPGYVGYEEGGQLTEKVRRKPYSIVLLDEIEKAHPDVYHLLLQVLDDGLITDSLGRRIDFKNTIIIMTSNIGSRQLKEFGHGVGFNTSAKMSGKGKHAQGVIENALKKTFAPEFLNRIDDIVIFDSLEREDIHKIINIVLRYFNPNPCPFFRRVL